MPKMQKNNKKLIVEKWSPMIQKTTGVTDPDKLAWMSELANNTANHLNEDATGGAYQQAPGAMGGVYSPYSTLYNTVGVGNVVPAGRPALTGADYTDPRSVGSGDKFPSLLPIALKVAAKTIGFELVNTMPLAGPAGVLPYMDYVYAGSKQPYGATPAHDAASANPKKFQKTADAYSLYGLPHAIKVSFVSTEDKKDYEVKQELRDLLKKAVDHKVAVKVACTNPADASLSLEWIGFSRIDSDPMFKVVSATHTLGELFADAEKYPTVTMKVTTADGEETAVNAVAIAAPRLISMLEDQVQGFAGAGPNDSDPWFGTYQDGTRLYEPMSRGTGELQYARQLSLQLFTKNVQVGTVQVSAAVTQEQIQDLQKQWGIDVVKMVENAAVNELSATINRHITSRLFGLGWKNHVKLVEVEGASANLNLTFDPAAQNGATVKSTPAYAVPQYDGTESQEVSWVNVSMPYRPVYMSEYASFENRDTLIKRIQSNFLAASNWILQRGRFGAATFAVTNITVATALQTNAAYSFSPIANNISQNGGSLYPIGTMAGMTIYCDPLMAGDDNRVLVGRKGGKEEPGTVFCPYILAESIKMIAEGTASPKLVIKSRYALIDAGFFPETQYLTFALDLANIM